MAEQSTNDLLLGDPLATITRTERSRLLISSAITAAIVKTGLVPAKISALGIEISNLHQQAYLSVFAAITLYFLISFSIYATADFLAWFRVVILYNKRKDEIHSVRIEHKSIVETPGVEPVVKYQMGTHAATRADKSIFRPFSVIRALFEFALPLIVGIYAICLIWW